MRRVGKSSSPKNSSMARFYMFTLPNELMNEWMWLVGWLDGHISTIVAYTILKRYSYIPNNKSRISMAHLFIIPHGNCTKRIPFPLANEAASHACIVKIGIL